ncbi:MAG TPA: hypothetical protein VFF79_03035 [Conexibacter sp.]|jgi:hypothetical protein|nr:hypothetical protein [Conexibacter sp.]
MGFVGTLSNPDTQERLRRLLDKLERVAGTETSTAPRRPEPQPECAPVLSAVTQVLRDVEGLMRARAVHAEVEALRGAPVAWSSVKDYLASNAQPGGRFVRVARGRYCLAGL